MGHDDAAIWAQGLAKQYRGKAAVNGLDLDIPRGCICGFLGPNGAGKTSTIRMLMGLMPPTAGRMRVLGLDPLRHAMELKQQIGYVPDQHRIYPWMTLRQVLSFAASIYKRWDAVECRRIIGVLNLPLDRRVKQLSRGEMAKLALVIALSHRPELLILDEPTTGLDPLVRQEFLDAVEELIRQEGRTVFFSTHILSDVERVADRIVIVNEGRVVVYDQVEALRGRYTKASFLFAEPPSRELTIQGALRVHKGLREWVAVLAPTDPQRLQQIAAEAGALNWMVQPMTVEDVFVELLSNGKAG